MSAWRPTTFLRTFRGWRVFVWETVEAHDVYWRFAIRKHGRSPDVQLELFGRRFSTAKKARVAAIRSIKLEKPKVTL